MNVLSIILLIFLGVAFVFAIGAAIGNGKKGGCGGCNGDCANCHKNKK